MILPNWIVSKYGGFDADTKIFFDKFEYDRSLSIIEIGSNEEYIANILTELGHNVTGVDLRLYKQQLPCNYNYVRHDVNTIPLDNQYDVAVAISAIEHIGLSTYKENCNLPYYDVIAMHNIWRLLKYDGIAYITVPFGTNHIDYGIHWRVYNTQSLIDRIIQHFHVDDYECFASGEVIGMPWKIGDKIQLIDILKFSGDPPHLTIYLKLRKVPVNILSPDER